ncbi:DUF1351 domain-containing protein [Streptococcus iniae]|uniref:DUF1351 domain-containing protein n=1 Tax=Streptococcus iniae TaxID=1346 RepID=UPI000EFD39B9|nr:DUF1351 domain-containing protein [Streptococcus iniae]RMI79760.1 hypothetical protein DIX58_00760 [Streptococcus iniae]
MQELQVKVTQAQVEIIDREKFEQNINDVVAKYKNYTVTASRIKEDKQVLADLRKLKKQLSDERIKVKKELSKPADEIDGYIKQAINPLDDTINKIAADVKEFEERQKALKFDTVKSYISNKCAEYLLDPRIFDEKATEYIKAADFMSDGVTLKKATMTSLDDMITFEVQKQEEFKKAKTMISSQCAEYGITDQPYIRMLKDLTILEVIGQIKADYAFELEKRKLEEAEREREQEASKNSQDLPPVDSDTGEILDSEQLSKNDKETLTEAKNDQKRYSQKMTLEVYFESTEEKDFFKSSLENIGFEYKKNYQVSGYQRIEPLTQDELNEQCGW